MKKDKLDYSKAICILSGGMDSTTLLYKMLQEYSEVSVMSFSYNQRHKRELLYAKKTCNLLGLEHLVIELGSLKECLLGSALTSKNISVPHGHYEDESMKLTVVPNRNSLMLNIALARAISIKAGVIGYGAHHGDHAIYSDCKPEFLEAMKILAKNIWYEPLNIYAPFMNITKTDIVKLGFELKVPFENTYGCYEGKERPCLRCGTDQERIISFRDVGVKDPFLTNEEWTEGLRIVKGIK